MGGWNTIPGSCSSGFRSRPLAAAGTRRSNGLLVRIVNSRKPTDSQPITPRMRASTGVGSARLKCATASVQPHCISNHSSIEPSWPPQTAATRYQKGRSWFELLATYRTEKSYWMKAAVRQA